MCIKAAELIKSERNRSKSEQKSDLRPDVCFNSLRVKMEICPSQLFRFLLTLFFQTCIEVPHMFLTCSAGSGCENKCLSQSLDMFWIFSCSLLVTCVSHVRVSPCEETAGQCVEASQRASGRVDEVSNTWRTWNWKNTKISGWRRGAVHVWRRRRPLWKHEEVPDLLVMRADAGGEEL